MKEQLFYNIIFKTYIMIGQKMKKVLSLVILTTVLSACSTTSSLMQNNQVTNNTKQHSYMISVDADQPVFEQYFAKALDQQLINNNIKKDLENSDTMIKYELDFDKGNRALRYWVGFGAGKAKAHVKVYLINKQNHQQIAVITTDATMSMGAFGGDANSVLENAAKDISKKIVAAQIFE